MRIEYIFCNFLEISLENIISIHHLSFNNTVCTLRNKYEGLNMKVSCS